MGKCAFCDTETNEMANDNIGEKSYLCSKCQSKFEKCEICREYFFRRRISREWNL